MRLALYHFFAMSATNEFSTEFDFLLHGPQCEKTCLWVFANKGNPACASVQSDQRLCCALIGKYHIKTCNK